ncbi:MAG TPA: patatin-like phospholipase family protein [Candidatus Binataceae bacterium]|nr:patatin-like phospholipase family protein [Candidatus Binataceae bacterium]
MAEKRLAISIKGGVSLGAYEAGALSETLRMIAFNNTHPESTKWYVDVLTGASAGSITAALVAATLINQQSNPLDSVWLERLSLEALSPPKNSGSLEDSYFLLDASKLDVLAQEFVGFPNRVSRHPAVRPGDAELRLRFTLSRVNPSMTEVPTPSGDTLNIEKYAYTGSFFINMTRDDSLVLRASGIAAAGYSNPGREVMGADAWKALQQTAIASGTFPLAFAPRNLRVWDEQHLWRDTYFVDGGLFDNDPMGEAINVAHDLDWYSPGAAAYDDADRHFMVIHTEPFVRPQDLPGVPDPYTLLMNVVGSLLTESQTSGLREIPAVNERVKQRSDFLQMLASQIASGATFSVPPGLLEQLAKWRGINIAEQLPVLQRALIPDLQRTDPQTHLMVGGFTDAMKQRFSDTALAMDLALNVADKVTLSPILVAPKAALAGNPLYGFGGFLVPAFRAHDFQQGRYDAWATWSAIARSQMLPFVAPALGDMQCPPPIVPEDPQKILAANRAAYEAGEKQFFDRVNTVAERILTKGRSLGTIGDVIVRTLLGLITRKALG